MTAGHFDVYGIGNAIVDIQLRVEETDIQTLGLQKGGMQLVGRDEQHALLDAVRARHTQGAINLASGGSAANTMIALAQLGSRAAYGCVVGIDELGSQYVDEMRSLRVHLHNDPAKGDVTGTCLVLITPDAERTMNTHLGISATISEEHVSEQCISTSEWVYIEGYLFSSERGQRAALKTAEVAKARGAKVAVTFSDSFIVEIFGEPLRKVVSQADLVFANLREGQSFTGESEPRVVLSKLRKEVPHAVLTMSEKGALVSSGEKELFIAPVPTRAVDDTGAGDMFAGAYLHGMTKWKDEERAGKLACLLASRVVSQMGPRLEKDLLLDKEVQALLT